MNRGERLGLGVSTAAHVLLIAALSLGLLQTSRNMPSPPPSIDVMLADEVALESRTPNPSVEPPQVATAPEIGPVEPETAPPDPAPPPPVAPPPTPRAREPDRAAPPPRREAREQPQRAQPRAEPRREAPPRRARRLGADFLKGIESDAPAQRSETQTPGSSNAPLGAAAARALNAEISRQLKRYWRAPTGADADQLVTVLRWRLNRDGTIASGPEVVEQTGQTPSNRPQQQLHIEAAIRAVRAAAPFQLPPDLYDSWKYIREFSFDRRL